MKRFPGSSVLLFLFCVFCCCGLAAQQPSGKKAEAKLAAERASGQNNQVVRATQKVLRLAPGQVVFFPDQVYAFDTLAMGFRARIMLQTSQTTITVDQLFVSGQAFIDGQGNNGGKGKNGKPGNNDDYRLKTKASDGQAGEIGILGEQGKDLNLYLGQGVINGQLVINLNGGNGGDGGDGGDGGKVITLCGRTNKGTNGGNAGLPGGSGSPGNLKIIFGSEILKPKVAVNRLAGRKGQAGKPGLAGKFSKNNCPPFPYKNLYRKGMNGIVINDSTVNSSIGGGKMPEGHLDEGVFPDVPPAASAIKVFDNLRLSSGTTFNSIHERLSAALEAAEYKGYNVQRWRDGFAIISPIEQIDERGRELPGNDRWQKRVFYNHSPSILSYLKSLVFDGKGYFRVVVFLVGTPGDRITSARKTTKEEAMSWFEAKSAGLPTDLVDKPFGPGHSITALIYDFVKSEKSAGAYISKPLNQRSDSFIRTSKLFTNLD